MRTLAFLFILSLAGCERESTPVQPTRAVAPDARSTPRSAETPADRTPAPPPIPSRGTFLLVYADPLVDAADAWAAYRESDGWRVDELAVSTGDATGPDAPERLRERIVERYETRRGDPFVVLLLGDRARRAFRRGPTASVIRCSWIASTGRSSAFTRTSGWTATISPTSRSAAYRREPSTKR